MKEIWTAPLYEKNHHKFKCDGTRTFFFEVDFAHLWLQVWKGNSHERFSIARVDEFYAISNMYVERMLRELQRFFMNESRDIFHCKAVLNDVESGL